MLATENLMKEHQLILKYVDLMARYAGTSVKYPDSPFLLEQAADFIAFIHEFADQFHHAKEEDSLFRYLAEPGVLTHCNPIPQMLMEHEKARGYLRNMEQAVQAKALNAWADNAAQYARLLKEHIYKENNILYPMAENGMSDQAKTTLSNECAQTDERLDSQAIWGKYTALYAELEQRLKALAD